MKKSLLILVISLLLPTFGFSQSTFPKLINDSIVAITTKQLKATNLIFLEHQKLKQENQELTKQISDYKNLIANYNATDAIKTAQIKEYDKAAYILNNQNQKQATQIVKLQKSNKKWRSWTVGGFALSLAFLGILVIK